jgi:hypothetical protein
MVICDSFPYYLFPLPHAHTQSQSYTKKILQESFALLFTIFECTFTFLPIKQGKKYIRTVTSLKWTELAKIRSTQARKLSDIALIYGLDDRGFESRQGLGIFPFTTEPRPSLGPTQPPTQWVPGVPSLEVKRPGREADHSPPFSVEVKECMELHLYSPIRLHGVVLR